MHGWKAVDQSNNGLSAEKVAAGTFFSRPGCVSRAAHRICLNLLHNKLAKTNDSVNQQWAVQLEVAWCCAFLFGER